MPPLNLTEEEIYQRVMARIAELMASEPELESRDGIELDHLAAVVELYERIKWPMGRAHETQSSNQKLNEWLRDWEHLLNEQAVAEFHSLVGPDETPARRFVPGECNCEAEAKEPEPRACPIHGTSRLPLKTSDVQNGEK